MNAHASESLNLKQASLLLAQEQEHVPLHQTWLTDIKSIDAQLKDVFTSGKVLGLASRSDSGETTVCLHTDVRRSRASPLLTLTAASCHSSCVNILVDTAEGRGHLEAICLHHLPAVCADYPLRGGVT